MERILMDGGKREEKWYWRRWRGRKEKERERKEEWKEEMRQR